MKRKIQIVIGLFIGVFLVWFLFRETHWPEVFEAIRNANIMWLLLSVVSVLLSFVIRIQRWSYIVRTAKHVSFKHMFNATQIGFLANFVLPARIGEFVRPLVLTRLTQIPLPKTIAFHALDRIMDLAALLVIMMIGAIAYNPTETPTFPAEFFVPDWAQQLLHPNAIRTGAMGTAAVIIILLVALVVIYLNAKLALRIINTSVGLVSKRLAQFLCGMVTHFAEGLHVFRSKADMSKSYVCSLLIWVTFLITYGALILAFGVSFPWYAPFVVLSVIAVVISLPGAPGFIGQFHFAIMFSLFVMVPGLDADVAAAIAILGHLINLIPVVIVGLVSLYQEHLGLWQLERESEHLEKDLEQDTQAMNVHLDSEDA
jgi:uncharacterized membrane protein YbhN (UPF0104 family)